MNIYLISQDVNRGYETYDSAVVVAENEGEARITCPSKGFFHDDQWCSPGHVKVKLIGVASSLMENGVVCASYNSG